MGSYLNYNFYYFNLVTCEKCECFGEVKSTVSATVSLDVWER